MKRRTIRKSTNHVTPNDLRQPGMISFEMNSQKVAVNLTHPVPMLFTARTGTPGLITGVLFVLAFLELCVFGAGFRISRGDKMLDWEGVSVWRSGGGGGDKT